MSPFERVVAYAPEGVVSLALGMAAAVFRTRPDMHRFGITFCTDRPGLLSTELGVPIVVGNDLSAASDAELLLVLPAGGPNEAPSPPLAAALEHALGRGAIVAAHCAGVFTLAGAGLLDGREATTHWHYANQLRAQHPTVRVRPEALYVDEGLLVTGAGAAAGADMYLHLVRREHGGALANALARLLVLPPHRHGDQQQYVDLPVDGGADGDRMAEVIDWARRNVDRPLTVDVLADRAAMSRRSFIRHFEAATGSAPHRWLLHQRLNRAEELLETSALSVEEVARRVGFSSAAVLRERFIRRRGVGPRDYRRSFTHE